MRHHLIKNVMNQNISYVTYEMLHMQIAICVKNSYHIGVMI